jgi:hypothetical protein
MVHKNTEDGGMQPVDTLRGSSSKVKRSIRVQVFYAKTQIQIVVRNPNCIKSVFHGSPNQMPAL